MRVFTVLSSHLTAIDSAGRGVPIYNNDIFFVFSKKDDIIGKMLLILTKDGITADLLISKYQNFDKCVAELL